MGVHIPTQSEYVVELTTQLEVNSGDNQSEAGSYTVIGLNKFKILYQRHFPDAQPNDAALFWHSLFGNNPETDQNDIQEDIDDLTDHKKNVHAHYLTDASCNMILNHHELFRHGFDFKHMPKGFFLTKNPSQDGLKDVLHYSDYIARQSRDNPFAITLNKKTVSEEQQQIPFENDKEQQRWFEFLLSKKQHNQTIYCTDAELKTAFIAFSKAIEKLDLKFYEPNFSVYDGVDCNPMLLISRWLTIVKNPQLKKEDLEKQWQVLPQLDVANGYSVIRAITDYQYTDTPCGFLLPEMFVFNKYNFIKPEKELDSYNLRENENYFWSYIAYQKARHSIDYYYAAKKAITDVTGKLYKTDQEGNELNGLLQHKRHAIQKYQEEIVKLKKKVKENEDEFSHKIVQKGFAIDDIKNEIEKFKKQAMQYENKMLGVLVSATTGNNYKDKNENADLTKWNKICQLIDNAHIYVHTSLIIVMAVTKEGYHSANSVMALLEIIKSTSQANNDFIYSLAKRYCVLCKESDLVTLARNKSKFMEIVNDSELLLDNYKTDLYIGCRFYVVNEWKDLNIEDYFKLVKRISETNSISKNLLVASLSTFAIKQDKDFNEMLMIVTPFDPATEEDKSRIQCVEYFLELCKKVNKPLSLEILDNIINKPNDDYVAFQKNTIDSLKKKPNDDYVAFQKNTIDSLKKDFHDYFPEGYLDQQLAAIEKLHSSLPAEQMNNIKKLCLPNPTEQKLNEMELKLLKSEKYRDKEINHINELLANLNFILSPSDFNEFIEKISDLSASNIPFDYQTLTLLLNSIIKARSVMPFNQIYFASQKENYDNDDLPKKMLHFVTEIISLPKQSMISPIIIKEFLARITLHFDMDYLNKDYKEILDLLSFIDKNHSKHPHTTELVLSLIDALPDKNTKNYIANLTAFKESLVQLQSLLDPEQSNQHLLLYFTLLTKARMNPMGLSNMVNKIHQPYFTLEQQQYLLLLAKYLIKTKDDFTDFNSLIDILQNRKALEVLQSNCNGPPLPPINTLIKWFKEPFEPRKFEQEYKLYSSAPFGERNLNFAFDLKKYQEQSIEFTKLGINHFDEYLGNIIDNKLTQNRSGGLTVADLRIKYQQLKEQLPQVPLNEEQKLDLLCLCIEMLARTTSQMDNGKIISQELNSTQVMALYAIIMNDNNKVISQIDTGEGKSRINMVLAAFQAAQGMTVDFQTSDLALAERDFLSYNAYFSALDIQTSLITLDSPPALYQRGGVNFTDINQLVLLRNKSDVELKKDDYLDPNKANRCLLIDEADKFLHDKSRDSYNYAVQSKKLAKFMWVYPLLVKYVKYVQSQNADFNYQDHIDSFLKYVGENDPDQSHEAVLASLKDENNGNQIAVWLKSAETALKMERDKQYKVTQNTPEELVLVRDSDGFSRFSRKVLVLDGGRPALGSTFSAGVHQCLCAKENLRAGKEEFIIPPENITMRISYPVSYLAQYDKGKLFGFSGTTRSEIPKKAEKVNYEKYSYLTIPRHQKLIRKDKHIVGAKDDRQQFQLLKRAILQKLKKNQPILIICRDDNETDKFHKFIEQDPELKAAYTALVRVHGLSKKAVEEKAIEKGGLAKRITVSTVGMFGRGVDINAEKLAVFTTYIPSIEDEIQIKGRTARGGKKGEYRMIINVNDSEHKLTGVGYNLQKKVQKSQHKMAIKAFGDEEINKLYARFLENVTQRFLDDYATCGIDERQAYLQKWTEYLDTLNKDWHNKRSEMWSALKLGNKNDFIFAFKQFTQKWEGELHKTFAQANEQFSPKMFALHNPAATYEVIAEYKRTTPEPKRITVQKRYDMGDDGQARIYARLFAQEIAILTGERRLFANFRAWREGRGVLFADLRASLKGERPLFANLRAFIARNILNTKGVSNR